MDYLIKKIKDFSPEEYKDFLQQMTGNKRNHTHQILDFIRKKEYDEEVLFEGLGIDKAHFYTVKSRMLDKFIEIIYNIPPNPLKMKVANVLDTLFYEDKFLIIRYLKGLESDLIAAGLDDELELVYKAISRFYIYDTENYEKYNTLYHEKRKYNEDLLLAEDLMLMFVKQLYFYRATHDKVFKETAEEIKIQLGELAKKYNSHRFYIVTSMANVLFELLHNPNIPEMKAREMEFETFMKRLEKIFEEHELDNFCQMRKPLINFLYMLYYGAIGAEQRAIYYFKMVKEQLPHLIHKPYYSFFISLLLRTKENMYILNGRISEMLELKEILEKEIHFDHDNIPFVISVNYFIVFTDFHAGNIHASINRILNLRKMVSLRQFEYYDIEFKSILCLCYLLVGNKEGFRKYLTNIENRVDLKDPKYFNANLFLKFLKTVIRPTEYHRRVKVSKEILNQLSQTNIGFMEFPRHFKITDDMILKLAKVGNARQSGLVLV